MISWNGWNGWNHRGFITGVRTFADLQVYIWSLLYVGYIIGDYKYISPIIDIYIYICILESPIIYIYIQSYRDSNHHYNRKLRLTQNGLVPISNILLSSASLKGRSNRTPLSWISLRSQTWVCLEIGYIGYIPQWNSRFMWRKWVFFRVLIQWTQWGTLFSDKPTSQEWTQCEDFTLVLRATKSKLHWKWTWLSKTWFRSETYWVRFT